MWGWARAEHNRRGPGSPRDFAARTPEDRRAPADDSRPRLRLAVQPAHRTPGAGGERLLRARRRYHALVRAEATAPGGPDPERRAVQRLRRGRSAGRP